MFHLLHHNFNSCISTPLCADLRVRYTSELIDGIATVKSYSWEDPFFSLLSDLRGKEMQCIKQSQTLRAVNQGLFYCIPWVAAFSTFSVFWATGE